MPKVKSSTKLTSATPKLKHFSKLAPKLLPKSYQAVVGYDRHNRPAWFLFDLPAFWELICRLDETMFKELPEEKYEVVSLGKLIDSLEEHWPFSNEFRAAMKTEYEQALSETLKGKIKIASL